MSFHADGSTIYAPALPFEMSLAVWGAVYTGDTAEPVACMAEGDKDTNQHFGRMWDQGPRSRRYSYEWVFTPANGYQSVPAWWSLPWLTQHILRGHAAYPQTTPDSQEPT